MILNIWEVRDQQVLDSLREGDLVAAADVLGRAVEIGRVACPFCPEVGDCLEVVKKGELEKRSMIVVGRIVRAMVDPGWQGDSVVFVLVSDPERDQQGLDQEADRVERLVREVRRGEVGPARFIKRLRKVAEDAQFRHDVWPIGTSHAGRPIERTPDGRINNCAVANGFGPETCQLCEGRCPDRDEK